jgi:hypothetical protein
VVTSEVKSPSGKLTGWSNVGLTTRYQPGWCARTLSRRCGGGIDQRRLREVDAVHAAAQLWSMLHGFVTLELAGHSDHIDDPIAHVLLPLGTHLLISLGDDPDRALNSGADVIKALALGATAVGIGRPYAYGLALGGTGGIVHVLRSVLAEADLIMAVDGYPTLADLTPEALQRLA